MSGTEERATPFYCPYCSDEDLRPDAADGEGLFPGTWRCMGCSRVFSLRYVGAGNQPREVS